MSKPAARIGDMHLCPLFTPGLPPIPHVGGPITGPGVPTVLIGGMPAAVMGDMCVCVGPPDSIILGSTGVLIGNKPAARMGDMTAHGGSIIIGCPTVLIGEISPGTIMTKTSLTILEQMPQKEQATSMTQAAEEGKPFCEVCNEISNEPTEEQEEELETMPELLDFYITDEDGNRIEEAKVGDEIFLVVETVNMLGETVDISLSDDQIDYEYQGKRLNNDTLKEYIIDDNNAKILLMIIAPQHSDV